MTNLSPLSESLQYLESRVRDELQREFSDPDQAQQLEIVHRHEDYKTWQMMHEAPQQVEALTDTVVASTGLTGHERQHLIAEVTAMLTRLYADLLAPGRPEIPSD